MKLAWFLCSFCVVVALLGTVDAAIECAGCTRSDIKEPCPPPKKDERGVTCGGDAGHGVNFCRTEFSDDGKIVTTRHCAAPRNFKFETIKNGCFKAKFNQPFQSETVLRKTCFCDTANCNTHTEYDGND